MHFSLRPSLLVAASLPFWLAACDAGGGGVDLGSGATGGSFTTTGGTGAAAGSGGGSGESAFEGGGAGGGAISTGGSGMVAVAGSSAAAGACQTAQADAMLVREPVDIIVVLDNSGSMAEEMGAAEENINVNFANILDQAQADYRVILLSRHRQGPRDEEEEYSTSICVSTPLSGLASCPSENPTFSDRFFQWGGKIESFDALDWMIEAYDTPPEDDDAAELAPNGYGEWLRADAKKVFVVMTDDDESNDDEATPLTVESFLAQLTAKDPAAFGTAAAPSFGFHSIIGVEEKADPTAAYEATEPLVEEECTGNGADIEATGITYQKLSILTDGLRFPLCQFPGYDAVFRTIAENVIVKSNIACEFDIPPPPAGTQLDLDKVAVRKTTRSGAESHFLQALTAGDCQADAFYIDRSANQVHLCPEACETVRADPLASVDVLFTCMSTLIVK